MLSAIALTLALVSANQSMRNEFLAATAGTIVTSFFVILLYLTSVVRNSWRIWIKIELNFAFVWSIFLFACSFMVYISDDRLYSLAGVSGR